MLGDETHLPRGRPCRVSDQHTLDQAFSCERVPERLACLVLADQTDKNATCAKARNVASHVPGATDIGLGALYGDHRRRRFRRNARDLAIDELVEHQVADAQHRLADKSIR